jgi:prepilin-type N-terminal cleavage/methylation domain-containing protein
VRRGASGFSLIEVLLALGLLSLGLLSIAPLYVWGTRRAAASADFGKVGAAAVKRMELLRATGFGSLAAGGSLTSDVTSYSDTTDPAVFVRWTIADNASPATVKTINVIAIARRVVSGPAKKIQFATKRSK